MRDQLLIERFVSGVEDGLGTVTPVQDTGPVVPGAAWDSDRGLPENSGPDRDEIRLPVDSTVSSVSAAGTEPLHTPSRPAEALDHEAMMMSPTTNSAAFTCDALTDLDPGSATHESCQVLCLTFSLAAGVIAASAGRRSVAQGRGSSHLKLAGHESAGVKKGRPVRRARSMKPVAGWRPAAGDCRIFVEPA